jgi:hypothetical protein
MLRVCLEIILPLLLPTVLYLLWVTALRPAQPGQALPWAGLPWIWLGGAGLMLLAVVVFLLVYPGGQRDGVYVPPHLEGGRIVPGHFEAKPRP